MNLSGIDFVIQYESMLDYLSQTMSPEFQELIFRYRYIDPHDLVSPDDVFPSKQDMIRHLATLIWIDHLEGDPVNRN